MNGLSLNGTAMMTAKKQIFILNKPRAGALGEYVFKRTIEKKLSCPVTPVHKNRADFRIEGRLIDVKTRRRFAEKRLSSRPFRCSGNREKRKAEVEYGYVEFFDDCCVVRLGSDCSELSWGKVGAFWKQWCLGRAGAPKSYASGSEHDGEAIALIKSEVFEFFKKNGIKPRIIYRTCRKIFGDESPGNLIPLQPAHDQCTVYLDFHDWHISKCNIYRIWAFPDREAKSLPRYHRVRLITDNIKVDLQRMPKRYSFNGIADLMRNYFKRFPVAAT